MALESGSLLVIVVVGLIAGWIAAKVVRGTGLGLIGDLVVGIIGAFIGRWLFGALKLAPLGNFWIDAIAQAAIGAIVLLIVLRLIKR
jgi:uncharacterized membrane protein YeaQ/YmgE (transglycosylase-associated protein family)